MNTFVSTRSQRLMEAIVVREGEREAAERLVASQPDADTLRDMLGLVPA